MATEVVMPKLGLTMERGTIGAWLKREGDAVERGEPLLEVVTDKVTMEVEAQASGMLRRILIAEGEEVDVATPIAVIAAPEEDVSGFSVGCPAVATSPAVEAAASPRAAPQGPLRAAAAGPSPGNGRRPHRASPKARKVAAELGVDLASIAGTGPGGRVLSRDVEASERDPGVAVGPQASSAPVALTRAQQVAAERLTASYQQAPHIYLDIAVSALWLEQFRNGFAAEGKKISYNDLILQAVATTLIEHPRLNAHFVDGQVHPHGEVDIGIATDTAKGLLVPVLRGVDGLSVEQISAETRRLTEAARGGRTGPDDLTGGSFTLSNLGMFGISRFTAILNPPQVAILAVGAIEHRVVAVDGSAMAVRPMLDMTLSADHRAVDGATAARFLQRLKEILESPGRLA